MLKILVDYPTHDEELTVVARSLETPPRARAGAVARGAAGAAEPGGRGLRRPGADQLGRRRRHRHAAGRPSTASGRSPTTSSYGASPRGPISLVAAGRALALIRGRDYVVPGDLDRARPRRVPPSPRALLPRARRGGRTRHDPRPGARRDADRRRSISAARRRSECPTTRSPRSGPRTSPAPARSRPRRCARSSFRSAGGSTASSPATTAPRSRASAASCGRCGRTSPATTCAASSGTSPPAPASRTCASSWPSACSSRGSCSTRPPRWRSAPATGARRTSPRASRSRSGYAATRRGNRLGTIAFGAEPVVERPRQGRRALLDTMHLLRDLPPSGTGTLREALELADRVTKQRALVVVVSDFRGPIDWRPPLLRLAGRHAVLAVEVRDPREQELADVGELRLVDPETGRQLRVDTSDRRSARALRGGRGGRTPSARLLARLRRRAARRAVDRRRLAAAAGRVPPPGPPREMSFAAPVLLVFLLAVPAAVAGHLWLERRRDDRAAAWAPPALLPNMAGAAARLAAAPARRAAARRRRAPARRLRPSRRDDHGQAAGGDRDRGARRLGLDGGERLAADAPRRREGGRAALCRRRSRRATASPSSPSPTTRRSAAVPTNDLARVRAVIANAKSGPAGNGARRRGRARQSRSHARSRARSRGSGRRR